MTAPDPRQDLGSFGVPAGDPLTINRTITANGTPVDLTTIGTTVTAKVAPGPAPAQPVYSFDTSASVLASGQLVLKLTGAQTAQMESNSMARWYFDITFTGGTVSPQTPFKGSVVVYRGVTNG